MIQAAGQVVPLKLDVDRKEVQPLQSKYKVSGIPAVFIMDSDGKVLGTIEPTLDTAKLRSEFERRAGRLNKNLTS